MSKQNALIVVKEPGKEPERRVVAALTLVAMQEIVGGLIEYIPLETRSLGPLDLFFNEEGKLEGLEPNVWTPWKDVIVGTLFVCRADDEGENIGLTEEEAAAAEDWLKALDMSEAERTHAAAVIADMV